VIKTLQGQFTWSDRCIDNADIMMTVKRS